MNKKIEARLSKLEVQMHDVIRQLYGEYVILPVGDSRRFDGIVNLVRALKMSFEALSLNKEIK